MSKHIIGTQTKENTKVSLIIPVYRDKGDTWEKVFIKKHLNSYYDLAPMDNIQFLYNCQGFSGAEKEIVLCEIAKALENNPTWTAIVEFRDYYKMNPVSMARVRYDTASLNPDAEIVIMLDDDVVFHDKVAMKYYGIVKYMKDNPECGAIMSAGFLGGSKAKGKIKLNYYKHWWTNRGLFLRNISNQGFDFIYPEEHIDTEGGMEDLVGVLYLLENGYFIATSFNNNTFHQGTPMTTGKNDRAYLNSYRKKQNKDLIEDTSENFEKKIGNRYEGESGIHDMSVASTNLTSLFRKRYSTELYDSSIGAFKEVVKHVYNNYYTKNCKIDAYKNAEKFEIDIDNYLKESKGLI